MYAFNVYTFNFDTDIVQYKCEINSDFDIIALSLLFIQ